MRIFTMNCWTCDGYGISGYYLNPNVHVTVDCWTCHGKGYKQLRRHKR